MELTEEKLESMLDRKFATLKQLLDEVVNTLSFLCNQYDGLQKTVAGLQEENKKLQNENKSLRAEVFTIKNELKVEREALNNHEQYIRHECLEFSRIPEKKEEHTNQIVTDICEAIGIDISEEEISVSHRLPSKPRPDHRSDDRPKVIVARFVRRDIRDQIYKARSQLCNKTTKDIGYRDSYKIYISESLTQKNKELFKSCLQVKKSQKIKFIWTKYGKIFMRKDESPASPVVQIMSTKDLQKLTQFGHGSG